MKRLMRVWYRTDGNPSVNPNADGDYVGAFSDPFPENPAWRIVNVDWQDDEVEVTYLIPADHL